jgi:hypothetical protein
MGGNLVQKRVVDRSQSPLLDGTRTSLGRRLTSSSPSFLAPQCGFFCQMIIASTG